MVDLLLTKVAGCIAHGDRVSAVQLLSGAITDGQMRPRDGIELLLVLRGGSTEQVREAIHTIRTAPPGTYRYVPTPSQHIS
jgi:hypothetical protein